MIGRFDNIINSGGVKIQLEKVEKIVENHIQNSRFFAFGINDLALGQKLVLVIEADFFSEKNKVELLQKLKENLSKYEIPKQIFTVEKFSETPTDKIDKKTTIKRLNL